jgi:hypothetical protein
MMTVLFRGHRAFAHTPAAEASARAHFAPLEDDP